MDEKEAVEAGVKIITEVAKERAAEFYDDALKPAARESGGALGAVVGLFNHVVLYPIKKANLTFRYKLEEFERDLRTKIEQIPEDKIVPPPLAIAGPTLEALKYTLEVEELREMYLELIASAMNADKSLASHPAFVEVIKAMSSLDAQVFRDAAQAGQIACARITIGFEAMVFTAAMPEVYAPALLGNRDPFQVSASLEHLCRLGLLTHRDNTIRDFDYNAFTKDPFVEEKVRVCAARAPGKSVSASVNGEVILLNDFGRAFKSTCLP
jgi:hypothetical protein